MTNDNPDSLLDPSETFKQTFCGNLVKRSDASSWPSLLISSLGEEHLEPGGSRRHYKITMAGTGREFIFERARDSGNGYVRAKISTGEVLDLKASEIAIIGRVSPSKPKPAKTPA